MRARWTAWPLPALAIPAWLPRGTLRVWPVTGMADASLDIALAMLPPGSGASLALLADAAAEAVARGAGCVVLGGAGLAGLAPHSAPETET